MENQDDHTNYVTHALFNNDSMRPGQVWFTAEDTKGLKLAKNWVISLNSKRVPLNLFAVRYDRSSGPGGQNVNKVNSKCTIALHNFSHCSWFPLEVRKQLLEKKSRYYASSSDTIVIQSGESRSRETNREFCIEKFVNHIKEICFFPGEADEHTLKKWDRIKKKAHEGRIQEKKLQSNKKRLRNKKDLW
ncbi:YOL114C [Zygosaccharomyces parabailii]|nr:YOL114C [Zygosaccharomyces parabailii]CDH12946.1 related to Similarity to human DS-1 protein [Zygosaccharomyces bailii ISA1307]